MCIIIHLIFPSGVWLFAGPLCPSVNTVHTFTRRQIAKMNIYVSLTMYHKEEVIFTLQIGLIKRSVVQVKWLVDHFSYHATLVVSCSCDDGWKGLMVMIPSVGRTVV